MILRRTAPLPPGSRAWSTVLRREAVARRSVEGSVEQQLLRGVAQIHGTHDRHAAPGAADPHAREPAPPHGSTAAERRREIAGDRRGSRRRCEGIESLLDFSENDSGERRGCDERRETRRPLPDARREPASARRAGDRRFRRRRSTGTEHLRDRVRRSRAIRRSGGGPSGRRRARAAGARRAPRRRPR